MSKNAWAVSLKNVTKVYGSGESQVKALREVNEQFAHGSFTAIMGPSGSGKSTLLQCAAGLDKSSEGEVWLGETNIANLSETELTVLRRSQIGFIFQSFNLVAPLTAAQNIALPLQLAGAPPKAEAISAALTKVGLANRANHFPGQLSGGQQQRIAIARALTNKPQVLFADEPTGALDTMTTKQIMKLLRQTVHEEKLTIIMVTHDPVVAAYADKVIFLADGLVVDSLISPKVGQIATRMTQLEN